MSIFKKKISLRDACRKEYGDEFVETYDAMNRGCPIGGFLETALVLDAIQSVKKKYKEEGFKLI